jgi:hypothetical protein
MHLEESHQGIIMRALPHKRPSNNSDAPPVTNSYVAEALAKQAALRPPKTPPKLMPVKPTLPKMPTARKRRRRTV